MLLSSGRWKPGMLLSLFHSSPVGQLPAERMTQPKMSAVQPLGNLDLSGLLVPEEELAR